MSHFNRNLGIVAERVISRFTVFDQDTHEVLHQIEVPGMDFIDAVLATDCSRGILAAFSNERVVQVDLTQDPPVVIDNESTSPIQAEDVALTPDNRFAVVGGLGIGIAAYSLEILGIVDTIPDIRAQAVAVSPNGNGLVLASDISNGVHVLLIDSSGNLTRTGQTITTDVQGPINLAFHPSGKFAFVLNSTDPGRISIFDTSNPSNIQFVGNATSPLFAQTIVISNDGKRVYVLSQFETMVTVYDFKPSAPYLTQIHSFPVNGSIENPIGADQMALDHTGTKLFISASNSFQLQVYSTDGTFLGIVPGVEAHGGIDTCSMPKPEIPKSVLVEFLRGNNVVHKMEVFVGSCIAFSVKNITEIRATRTADDPGTSALSGKIELTLHWASAHNGFSDKICNNWTLPSNQETTSIYFSTEHCNLNSGSINVC